MAAIPASHFEIDVSKLTAICHILHLINHRNRNQHRRNGWWKWFSMLRRAVSKLLQKHEKNTDNLVKTHIAFMNTHLFPNCYISFSQLLTDGQFCALGLVLLAELARTRSAIGEPDVSSLGEGVVDRRASRSQIASTEDVGEVLVRPPHDGGNHDEFSAAEAAMIAARKGSDAPSTETGGQEVQIKGMPNSPLLTPQDLMGPFPDLQTGSSTTTVKPTTVRHSKKRRRLNLIDDLFKGLE